MNNLNTALNTARNRALFLDSILSSLNKAGLKDAVTVTFNCKVKDLRALRDLRAERGVYTNSGAQLLCTSENAGTAVTVNVTRG